MEESEAAENKHAVLKTVTSVTKDKHCRKRRIVGNAHLLKKNQKQREALKKRRESFKPSDAEDLYCWSLAVCLRELSPSDVCMKKHEINQLVFNCHMKRFVKPQLIITSSQPFSPTKFSTK